MSVQLRPSFLRCAAWVVGPMLVLTVITYLWQGYHENHWWTKDYLLTMPIFFAIAPLAVWFMFVPSQLEFSPTEITIKFPFRSVYILSWSDLQYYGNGSSVFMLQFSGAGTFQIFAQAFRRAEWRILKTFVSTTFPERKASGYIGDRMFRWPWKKT